MKQFFCPQLHKHKRRIQNLPYPNPHTVAYGLKTFGYKATQIWNSLPIEIRECDNASTFKNYASYANAIYASNMLLIWDIYKSI